MMITEDSWLKDFWYDKIRLPIKRFFVSISNLISWFPIIWRDQDWDHNYLYEILHFKLKRMEKCLRNGHHMDCEEDADNIQICVECLERLIVDEYVDKDWDFIRSKWGEIRWEECENKPGYCEMKLENIKTEKDEEEYRKDVHELLEKEENLVKDDLSLLFEVMKDKIRNWWD